MKRIQLSKNQLDTVIRLRQVGNSWLKIQKVTEIPRQVAQREYEEWERQRSRDELKLVRLNVAEEEFKQHLNHLTKVAEFLVDNLSIPPSPNTIKNAEYVLSRLWQHEIIVQPDPGMTSKVSKKRQTQRIVRQNQLLFKSLKDHTREKIRWEALNEWKFAWDNSIKILSNLCVEVRVLIGNILEQKPELLLRLQEGNWGKASLAQMVSATLSAIWRGIIDDKLKEDSTLVKTRSDIDGGGQVTSVDVGEKALLQFTERKTGEDFVKVLNWASTNLRKGDKASLLQQLSAEVHTMERAIRELEEALNPLLIRPLIMRTRCDLCPA